MPHASNFESRILLLLGVPAFRDLPVATLREVASQLLPATFQPEALIIREGDVGDRLYLIEHGHAEVITQSGSDTVVLATLAPGEIFGQMALLFPGAKRSATVKASTTLRVLALEIHVFTDLLNRHPQTKAIFSEMVKRLATYNFLKLASPFGALDLDNLQALTAKLQTKSVATGVVILRQGEPGDACYLIQQGRVEVVERGKSGEEKSLAQLGPGCLFGEAALLTDTPRSATVRALEPCELLALSRIDLLAALGSNQKLGSQLLEILQLRDRPYQRPGIVVCHRQTHEGVFTILKNPQQGTYYQLSPEGWFIWQQLDGEHNLRDLAISYFEQFKAFAPYAIAATIGKLVTAGFARSRLSKVRMGREQSLSWWQRFAQFSRGVLVWRLLLQNVDGPLSRLYHRRFRWVYTWPSQIFLGMVTLLGGITFFQQVPSVKIALTHMRVPAVWVLLIPMILFAVLVHEAGHAFTTKAFGREVRSVGLGWYWFGPIFFVDTSDMWLEKKWPRVAVSLSGVYANLVLAGIASLIGWCFHDSSWVDVCWIFALGSYVAVW